LSGKISIVKGVVYRLLFTRNGKLEIQETLCRYLQFSWKQATLHTFLKESHEVSEAQQMPKNEAEFEDGTRNKTAKPVMNNAAGELNKEKQVYKEGFLDHWDDTICNIELDMRHDKNGNVIGWMEGEPTTDEWDGSTDNKTKNLEEHVSKRGWLF